MDTVWKLRHQLSNQFRTLLPLLLRICPWLGRTSSMPSHDCEGVKAKPLASRGAHHCMCPIFHAAAGRRGQKRPTQSALTRCASLHVSRFPDGSDAVRQDTRAVTVFLGSVVAGNCLFDMASKGCCQKRHTIRTGTTIWRQESYIHEVTNRDCHIPLTTHFLWYIPCF